MKSSPDRMASAFSNKLAAMIEASGESHAVWASKFDLQIANFRKLLSGARPAGPKIAAKILGLVAPEMRTQLMVAYLFDSLVEVTINMESAKAGTPIVKPKALSAMVKAALGHNKEMDLAEVVGPLEPKLRKLMAMNDPLANAALSAVADALIAKSGEA